MGWFLLSFSVLALAQSGCALVVNRGSRNTRNGSTSRRSFLAEHATIALWPVFIPRPSRAQDDHQTLVSQNKKPYAPLEALLPATRLKVSIDQAYALSSSLQKTNSKSARNDILKQLDQILNHPPKLFRSEKSKRPVSGSLAQFTTPSNKPGNIQQDTNRSMGDRFAAILNQADVERQWGMLRYQESKREQENEARAAFNFYTSQLQYGDSYLLTASAEDKKRMIRNEELPSLTAVVTSDLDLRDLYRNQFLTAYEDVKAEVSYQLQQDDEMDTTDVVELLSQVHMACVKWFDLIPTADVQEAILVVSQEDM